MGGSTVPSLADVTTLMAPGGFYLPATLAMACGDHERLRVVLVTLFGTDQPNTMAKKEMRSEIMEKETEL